MKKCWIGFLPSPFSKETLKFGEVFLKENGELFQKLSTKLKFVVT